MGKRVVDIICSFLILLIIPGSLLSWAGTTIAWGSFSDYNKSLVYSNYTIMDQTSIIQPCGNSLEIMVNVTSLKNFIFPTFISTCESDKRHQQNIQEYSIGSYHQDYINMCCNSIRSMPKNNETYNFPGNCRSYFSICINENPFPENKLFITWIISLILFFVMIGLLVWCGKKDKTQVIHNYHDINVEHQIELRNISDEVVEEEFVVKIRRSEELGE